MGLLIIDNHDSFTYNLVQIIKELDANPIIIKNDDDRLRKDLKFERVLISPGPGLPHEAGYLDEFIKKHYLNAKILGVCLGHQALASFFGADLVRHENVIHGIASIAKVIDAENTLFKGIALNFPAARYHSWHVSRENLPAELQITSQADDGAIMSYSHKTLPLHGVQFHPESIMTLTYGRQILSNWLCS